MASATTLLVKRLPPAVTSSPAACHQFFSPFVPLDVRLMSSVSMRGSAFVDFPDNASAAMAREHLIRMEFNGKKLRVEYAIPSRDKIDRNMASGLEAGSRLTMDGPPYIQPSNPTHNPSLTTINQTRNVNEQSAVQTPIAPMLGVKYPSNPNLTYQYPDPTPEILNNIMHAIGSVPRLYNQVLHLMNKMNLPPPFGPVRRDAIPVTVKRKSDGLVASDESELESSGEEVEADRNHKRRKMEITSEHRQLALGKKKASSKIAIHIANLDHATEAKDAAGSDVIREPQEQQKVLRQDAPDNKDILNIEQQEADGYISIYELNSKKASPDDPQYSAAFKNYSEGEPTDRIYIKNLERKVVKESELRTIFGRFVLDNNGNPMTDLDINLLLSGRMRGQAFVKFKNIETAQNSLKGAHRYILHGKPMVIQFAKSPKS